MSAAVTAIGTAVPPAVDQDRLWDDFFADHFGRRRQARAIFGRSGVRRRGAVVSPVFDDVRDWPTGKRMQRFVDEAVPLGAEAVRRCLGEAGLEPGEVDLFAVVSCTGYATPGVDILLPAELAMSDRIERLHIGHMGCYAAIPGLAAVCDAATARGRTAVLLCVELPSLHLQPPSVEPDQIVAHALFADAAAAVAVVPGGMGLELVDIAAVTMVDHGDRMTWEVTEQGFRMGLSPQVPAILGRHVEDAIGSLLAPHGLGIADVAGWAVHPGGPRIVEVVGERLGLGAELDASRDVLAEVGNASSATVLVVLERLVRADRLVGGDHVVCMAFGPGLTLYAALLRHT